MCYSGSMSPSLFRFSFFEFHFFDFDFDFRELMFACSVKQEGLAYSRLYGFISYWKETCVSLLSLFLSTYCSIDCSRYFSYQYLTSIFDSNLHQINFTIAVPADYSAFAFRNATSNTGTFFLFLLIQCSPRLIVTRYRGYLELHYNTFERGFLL